MKIFTDHPAEVGETYTEHMAYASSVGSRMVLAGLACMIHGILPFLFKTTGSEAVARLHNLMMEKRNATYAEQVAVTKNTSQQFAAESASVEIETVSLDRAA